MKCISLHLRLMACFIVVVGCAQGPEPIVAKKQAAVPVPTPSSGASDQRPTSLVEQIAAKKKEETQLLEKKKSDEGMLSIQRSINAKLCERLFRYRTECSVAQRLIVQSTDNQVFGCIGNAAEGSRITSKFTVNLTGATGSWRLIADNDYYTQDFSAGQGPTVITWSSEGSSDSSAPRLADITELKLKISTGSVPASLAGVDFNLKVNDTVVFTQADLQMVDNVTGYYKLDALKLLQLRSSPACKVSAVEIDALVAEAKRIAVGGAQ